MWGTGELDVLSSLTGNNLVCVLKALIRLSLLVCFAALASCGLAGHDACGGEGWGVHQFGCQLTFFLSGKKLKLKWIRNPERTTN